jgi:hypothetical protein
MEAIMATHFPGWTRPVAIAAGLFGALTILSGGLALFGPPAAQEVAGNAVSFVLVFNFLAGFAYIAAAVALWLGHPLARPLALAIGSATLLVFAAFAVAALTGTPFEMRTVGAMTLRAGFWLTVALMLPRARTA